MIRKASSIEATQIRALLTEAFSTTILPFTIYRAPQSISHLAKLAAEGRISVAGDLQGIAITADNHLAYLAVADSARGMGFGQRLMDDFHERHTETTLDVLADNPALPWYEKLGYERQEESLSIRLAPKNTGKPPETWNVALREEHKNGFSAVDHAGMRVGLLGGTALRLLDGSGRGVRESLETLATIGFAGRREVVLMGLDEVPKGYETIQVARSVRMLRKG